VPKSEPSKKNAITKSMVKKVMRSFDWRRAAALYRFMEWRWATTGGEVPAESDLRRVGRELLDDLQADPRMNYTTTGGLRAVRNKDEGWEWLSLEFVALWASAEV